MGAAWAIARATFKEAVRARVFYILLFFGILIIITSRLFTWLSPGEEVKVVLDLGLASITLIGVIVTIFFGGALIPTDVERRTILTVLSKPVTRGQYVLGKFEGMALILLACVLPMGAVYWAAIYAYYPKAIEFDQVKAVLLIYLQLLVLSSVVIAISTLASYIINVVFAFAIYVMGNMISYMAYLAKRVESIPLSFLLHLLRYVVPNLELFNPGEGIFEYEVITGKALLGALGYGILYIAVMLLLAWLFFQEREV